MNTHFALVACAGLGLAVLTGCSPRDDDPAKPVTRTEQTLDRAADSTRDAALRAGDTLSDAWDDVVNATYDDRARVRASLENMANSADSKWDELQARGATLSASAKDSWNEGMEELREARSDLRREINELGDATAENWDKAKAEVGAAWERVRRSLSELEDEQP